MEDTREKLKIRENNLRKDVIQVLEKELDLQTYSILSSQQDELRDDIVWFINNILDNQRIDPAAHKKYLLKENPFGGNTDVLFDFNLDSYADFSDDIKYGAGSVGICDTSIFVIHLDKYFISVKLQQTNSGWEIKVDIPYVMHLQKQFVDKNNIQNLSEYIKLEKRRLLNDCHYPISIKDFLIKILHTVPYNNDNMNKFDFITVQKKLIKMIEKTMSHQPAFEHMGIQIPVKCEMTVDLTRATCDSLNTLSKKYPHIFTGTLQQEEPLMTIQ